MKRDDRYFIEDLKSKNGTFVHGDQVLPDVEFEIEEGSYLGWHERGMPG